MIFRDKERPSSEYCCCHCGFIFAAPIEFGHIAEAAIISHATNCEKSPNITRIKELENDLQRSINNTTSMQRTAFQEGIRWHGKNATASVMGLDRFMNAMYPLPENSNG